MLVDKATASSVQYRYQLLAQDFSIENGTCLLVIRDQENDEIKHFRVETLFNNNEFLGYMSPNDIKTIGYIQACEVNSRLCGSGNRLSDWS